MILFCGIPSEPPLSLAIEAAENAGISHVVLNQRESRYYDFSFDIGDDGCDGVVCVSGAQWPLSSFSGVYLRLTDLETLPEYRTDGRRRPDPNDVERAHAFTELLTDWLELATCPVVNRPSAMASNVSKPYQSQLIARVGFEIPPTLVTNDPDEARNFVREHDRVIFKSTSSVRSIVRFLDDTRMRELDRIRDLPTQFQQFIEGFDVRVHVVGDRLFATKARTDAVDYRYAARDGLDLEMSPYELQPEIASRCFALSASLQLPFCGIDLRCSKDRWVCFEVNPSPAYSWYQETTGQPIAPALVEWLSNRPG